MDATESRTKPLLTGAEAADHLGVPEPTLRHWRNVRKGPAYVRVGRHVRYRVRDLETWIDSQVVEPTPAA